MSDSEGPFRAFVAEVGPAIEATLERLLPAETEAPVNLSRAMRHAMFPGGKRLRPVLALLACRVTGGDLERALEAAAGLECMHTYSLVHDDLPCMDDDDLRRGRPTCHKVFGDAVAVLAGDALQALAFEAVATAGGEAVAALARASGWEGMVGGQVGDMEAEGLDPAAIGLERVEWIHERKTGALITASLTIGAVAAGADEAARGAVERYGRLLGKAFQIADDCLDLMGSAEELGKQPGQDLAADKLTYPAVLGLERSLGEARRLCDEAAALAPRICSGHEQGSRLDWNIDLLQDTARFVASRTA